MGGAAQGDDRIQKYSQLRCSAHARPARLAWHENVSSCSPVYSAYPDMLFCTLRMSRWWWAVMAASPQ
jgi:hypothetical protein